MVARPGTPAPRTGSLWSVSDTSPIRDLLRGTVLDAELAALLWLMVEARTPVVAVGESTVACDRLIDALRSLLPEGARLAVVADGDDFAWLPEAPELGWRSEQLSPDPTARRGVTSADGVLIARGLGAADGVAGTQARVVVRAVALGYGLLATMEGASLEDALNTLNAPDVGTDADERSRLGVVLVVGAEGGIDRILAAHYIRPVALDTHGHIQRQAPAVLATWNDRAQQYDHFAWGLAADLAGRAGLRPVELETELARRATSLAEPAAVDGW